MMIILSSPPSLLCHPRLERGSYMQRVYYSLDDEIPANPPHKSIEFAGTPEGGDDIFQDYLPI